MHYSEEIIEYIKSNPKISNRQLEKMFKINRIKIAKLKSTLNMNQAFRRLTKKETDYIIENAFLKTSEEISEDMKIPPSTIRGIWQRNNINKRKLFTPDEVSFVENYIKFNSSREMAKIYDVDKATILNFAKKIGFINEQAEQRLLNEENIKCVVDNYESKTSTELSKEFNCSVSRINQVWANNDLIGKTNRSYYSNFDYFEEINSKDKAYFLGFIAADGCVYDRKNNIQQKMLSIGIGNKDEEILIAFKNYIESSNPIIHSSHLTKNNYLVKKSQIQIVSDKLCDDLSKYNIVPRKTWTFSPVNIPNNLMWHFIRGYFDGDGSISCSKNEFNKPSRYNLSFVGNEKTMKYLREHIEVCGIKASLLENKNKKYSDKFYSLTLNNSYSKFHFLKKLYNDCGDLMLTRKKKIADKFIEACLSNETKRVKI